MHSQDARTETPAVRDVEVEVGTDRGRMVAAGDVRVAGPGRVDRATTVSIDVAKPGARDHRTVLTLEEDEARALRRALDRSLEDY